MADGDPLSSGGGFGGGGFKLSSSTASNAGGAVSDIFAGFGDAYKAQGDELEAGMYREGATLAEQNAQYTEAATGVKIAQQQRELEISQGRTTAAVAGAGFEASGSALDLLRESAQQGALAKGVLTQQGFITEQGYKEQADALNAQASAADVAASAAKSAETGSFISGALKGAAAIAGLF